MRLTDTERIEILMMIGYGDRVRTQEEVCHLFNAKYPNRNPISQSTVSRVEARFRETGHVKDRPKSGRPDIAEETKINVLLTLQENPHTSSRQIGLDNDIDHSTVTKFLRKQKWHPYKTKLVQELIEDDPDRRLQFCEQMLEICNADPMFVKRIIFSDEASFHLNGLVNKQNFRYWSDENPHWSIEHRTQFPQKINVWAGIVDNRILGPYFFEDNLTGNVYLDFLRDELIPALAVLFPHDDDPDLPHDNLWYQQDGAPPHYAANVRAYLNDIFPGRWIGRRGAIEWPARSPDLTPLDYFLWGYLKSKVYQSLPNTLEELKERIRSEVRKITPVMISNVQEEFISRLGHCQIVNGQQFEHLL